MAISYTMRDSAGGQFALSGANIVSAGELIAGDQTVTVRATDGNGWLKDTNFVIPVTAGAIPSWVRGDLGFDFANNRAYYNGVVYSSVLAGMTAMGAVYTRANAKPYINASGIRVEAPANELPIEYDPQTLEPLGPSFWPALTPDNKWGRDLTNAVWAAMNATVAKTATGLDGGANSASTVTASADNATVLQAITDATSRNRGLAMYIKRLTGTGSISITADGGTTWVDVTEWVSSTRFGRVNTYVVATTNPSIGIRLGTSGDSIAVDYVTLNRGVWTGPPLLTTDTVQSVSADVFYIPKTAIGIDIAQGALMYRAIDACDRSGGGGDTRYRFAISDGTTSNVLTEAGPQNMISGTPGTDAWDVQRQSMRAAIRWGTSYRAAIEGVLGNDVALTLKPAVTRFYLGCRSNGSNQAGAWFQEFWIKTAQPVDNDLIAFSSSRRGIMPIGDSLSIGAVAVTARQNYCFVARTRVSSAPRTFVRVGKGGTITDGIKPGESVDESAKAQWLANKDLRPGFRVLVWSGHNNVGDDEVWSRVIPFYEYMDAQTSGGCIYFTLICTYADDTTRFNQKNSANVWLRANLPASRVFDAIGYLIANGSDGSADDLADIAAGRVPRSCLGDAIHLNNKGSRLVGVGFAAHLNTYGG